MLKINILIAIIAVLFINSCKDEITSPNEIENIIPLNVGNKWIYQNYYYDSEGNQIGFTIDTLEVTADTIIQGERWFYVPGMRMAGGSDYSDLFTNRSNGLWMRSEYTDTTYTNLLYKYPVAIGEFWGTRLNDSVRVISTDDSVSTPFGNFVAIKYEDHYEFAWGGGHVYQYFAPSIGTVFFELYTVSNEGLTYLVSKKVLLKALLK